MQGQVACRCRGARNVSHRHDRAGATAEVGAVVKRDGIRRGAILHYGHRAIRGPRASDADLSDAHTSDRSKSRFYWAAVAL